MAAAFSIFGCRKTAANRAYYGQSVSTERPNETSMIEADEKLTINCWMCETNKENVISRWNLSVMERHLSIQSMFI